ncbi:hypothetical protein HHK36_018326 [Tetracentron sinense]|uniref:Uncharacterized protein n=1 Tax=Tetracentron sinense TaxID=13715 RepID=A0A834YVQ6_TETSI|nr:hypothetical protein HHK36_018326 [Tetracentron sinense]
MNLLGKVIRSNGILGNSKPNPSLSLLLRETQRHFSTETEQQQSPSLEPFLQPPSKGLIYGKLIGTAKTTMKTDIVTLLEGSNLTPQDIKVEYNRSFNPTGMIVQFPSRSAFDTAIRAIARKGQLYKLEKVDRSQWDILTSYDGKVVLLQGIPRNALPEDVERFLSGCDFNASSIQMFLRSAFPDPIRMALAHFSSQTQAMNAVLVKNRNFCLNNQISMRVLQ